MNVLINLAQGMTNFQKVMNETQGLVFFKSYFKLSFKAKCSINYILEEKGCNCNDEKRL